MKLSADDVELDPRERYLVAQALVIAARVLRSDPQGAHSNALGMETMLAAWFTPGERAVAAP